MFSEEDIQKFCDACNSFGATIEESVRLIDALSKKRVKHFHKSTPKHYGQQLVKKLIN